MANLLTKVSKRTDPAGLHEPFRNLADLLRWDPYRESAAWTEGLEFAPSFEVKETDNAYVFKADVPGITEENLDIQLAANRLTISGKREPEKKEEKEVCHLAERRFGSFTRTFALPEEVSPAKVDAHLQAGVLTLTVMKSPEVRPTKIKVSS